MPGIAFFNVGRVFAYPTAAIVLAAYGVVGYAIHAHLNHTWPTDDPRMMIPAMGFLALIPGVALLAFSTAYRKRLLKFGHIMLAGIATLGVLLLPSVFASTLFFDW
jgi:hypothetical protein